MKVDFKNGYLLLVIAIASSMLIFLHHINQLGFFHDGYLYAAFGKNAAELNQWLIPSLSKAAHFRFHDHIPFLFMLEGLFFKIFGSGFWQARLFVNIFSILIVFELFKFLRRNKYYDQSLTAVFFFLISLPFLKQSRFPNLDIPLTYFILMSFLSYLKVLIENKKSKWMIVGLWWGMSLLIKGPIAILVPITIFVHLISCKRLFKELKTIEPWVGLIIGIFLFSLWPLMLWLTGNIDVFQGYIQHTFLGTIKNARGVIENDYLLYFKHLATFMSLQLIFSGYSIYKYLKVKVKDEFFELNFIFIIVTLILMSFMKFKYSHYILPIFPSLAILSSFGLTQLLKIDWNKYLAIILIVGGVAVNLIPLSEKSFRDKDLFELQQNLSDKKIEHLDWQIVEGAYPYWAAHNFSAYLNRTSVWEVSLDKIEANKIILISNENLKKLDEQNKKYEKIHVFKLENVTVINLNE